MHTYIHTYIHTHIHTHIHTYILTCTHTYRHAYIHTLAKQEIHWNKDYIPKCTRNWNATRTPPNVSFFGVGLACTFNVIAITLIWELPNHLSKEVMSFYGCKCFICWSGPGLQIQCYRDNTGLGDSESALVRSYGLLRFQMFHFGELAWLAISVLSR